MKRLLIIIIPLIIISCGRPPQEREEQFDADGNVVSVPRTMIYIYKPDGNIDTIEAFYTYTSDGAIWWDDEDGFRHFTTLPVISVDLQREQ